MREEEIQRLGPLDLALHKAPCVLEKKELNNLTLIKCKNSYLNNWTVKAFESLTLLLMN